jgi:hypothetical protein
MADQQRNGTRQPCLFRELATSDRGYHQGFRYRVDQKDGDEHFFAGRYRAEWFIAVHGLTPISEQQMAIIRQTEQN